MKVNVGVVIGVRARVLSYMLGTYTTSSIAFIGLIDYRTSYIARVYS